MKKIFFLVLILVCITFVSCPEAVSPQPEDPQQPDINCKTVEEVREAIINELKRTGQINENGSIPNGTTQLTGNFNFIKLDPNLTDLSGLFYGGSSTSVPNYNPDFTRIGLIFNGDISNWDVSHITDMRYMFACAEEFNQSLNNWNVNNVVDMRVMFFQSISFNKPLDNWNVGKVTNMSHMFREAASFNQELNGWEVGSVTDMSYMFSGATSFNKPLNAWNVSNVTNTERMFSGLLQIYPLVVLEPGIFNQPLNNWVVSNITNMNRMFLGAGSFNQNISNWDVGNVTKHEKIFDDCPILDSNKPTF